MYNEMDNIYGDAFWVTGEIGYFLLSDEIARLNELNESPEDEEDPRFR